MSEPVAEKLKRVMSDIRFVHNRQGMRAGNAYTDPKRRKKWEQRFDPHYVKLTEHACAYVLSFPDNPHLIQVFDHMAVFLEHAMDKNLLRAINSYCALFDAKIEPVLVAAGFLCFFNVHDNSLKMSVLNTRAITQIKNTLLKAQKGVPYEDIIDAPVDVFVGLLQGRFDQEFSRT